jgi:hypothetical protein
MPATIVLSAYPGRYTPGGRELALSIGGAVPQRRVEVTERLLRSQDQARLNRASSF